MVASLHVKVNLPNDVTKDCTFFPTGGLVMNGVPIPNHGFAVLDNIGEGDESLRCLTDLPACCRRPYTDPMGRSALGNWFFPNGTRVVSSGLWWDFHRTRGRMVVLLQRRRGGAVGIYRCNVPDQNGEKLNLYVGVYTTNTGGYSQETSFNVSARKIIMEKNKGTQKLYKQSHHNYNCVR